MGACYPCTWGSATGPVAPLQHLPPPNETRPTPHPATTPVFADFAGDAGEAGPAADADARALRAAQAFDGRLHALAAPLTAGLSPIALALAWTDWALHLATQPAQSALLATRAQQQGLQWLGQVAARAGQAAAGATPGGADGAAPDARYAHPAWQAWPWWPLARAQHAAEAWWAEATARRGMEPHHRQVAAFMARQALDGLSPSNSGPLNPEVQARTRETLGANLRAGARHAVNAWRNEHGLAPLPTNRAGSPDEAAAPRYQPGVDVAITPGRVVHRNHLVELIQYAPATQQVQAEPVFIVPSWIMKYYILDLSPHNSLVRWLVEQGHTVFILSWRNPDESDALLGLDDYLELGVFDSLAAIARQLPGSAVHACGYCLGGTLLSMAAAALARPAGVAGQHHLPALASVTLLAAETDFSEPGEMGVLIDEAQVTLLEDLMAERGFLSGKQMAGSFAYLHARDLVWAARLRRYWLGEPDAPNDLMAWNADLTRMPAQMHSEYLRRCYLHNDLAEGRYPVQGQPVQLANIRQPMFVVATETDHVSPWLSVYKIVRLTDTALTFVLTSGGHNAGIVSEPGHPRRHHAVLTRQADGPQLDPQAWRAQAVRHEASWWPTWHSWLQTHGSGATVAARAPRVDAMLGPAPGHNVLQRYPD